MTAFATPTPPTISAVNPTSVRYWENRSTFCATAGEALVRVRTSQPASGNCACAASATAFTAGSVLPLSGSRTR